MRAAISQIDRRHRRVAICQAQAQDQAMNALADQLLNGEFDINAGHGNRRNIRSNLATTRCGAPAPEGLTRPIGGEVAISKIELHLSVP
jgi:hypothetical protein